MNKEESQQVSQQYADKASSMTEDDLEEVSKKQEKVFSLFEKIGEKAEDFKLLWNMLMDY